MPHSLRVHARIVKFLLLAVTLSLSTVLLAQIDTGSIVGTITDPSGAAIRGATVTLTNTATGVTRVATTNEDGGYQFAALIPGVYSVKASAASFDPAVRTNLEIDVQSRPAIDFTLKVGQSKEVVEVTSVTPILQTETADVGGVVQKEQINDLPLNGRRYSDLALLEAGIQRNLVNGNNTAPDRFSSNGNLETQNYFLAGWNRQQLRFHQPAGKFRAGHSASARRFAGVSNPDEDVFVRIWNVSGRRDQCQHQVGDEPVSRRRLGVSAQRCTRRKFVLSTIEMGLRVGTSRKISMAPRWVVQFSRTRHFSLRISKSSPAAKQLLTCPRAHSFDEDR